MSVDKTNHPFQAGVTVALLTSGWGKPRPVKRVVAKVHKNGNFILEGNPEQWKPYGTDWAVRTGRNTWDRDSLQVWTVEHDEMLKASDRFIQWRRAVEKITNTKVADPTPEMISAIQDVVTMIEGREP